MVHKVTLVQGTAGDITGIVSANGGSRPPSRPSALPSSISNFFVPKAKTVRVSASGRVVEGNYADGADSDNELYGRSSSLQSLEDSYWPEASPSNPSQRVVNMDSRLSAMPERFQDEEAEFTDGVDDEYVSGSRSRGGAKSAKNRSKIKYTPSQDYPDAAEVLDMCSPPTPAAATKHHAPTGTTISVLRRAVGPKPGTLSPHDAVIDIEDDIHEALPLAALQTWQPKAPVVPPVEDEEEVETQAQDAEGEDDRAEQDSWRADTHQNTQFVDEDDRKPSQYNDFDSPATSDSEESVSEVDAAINVPPIHSLAPTVDASYLSHIRTSGRERNVGSPERPRIRKSEGEKACLFSSQSKSTEPSEVTSQKTSETTPKKPTHIKDSKMESVTCGSSALGIAPVVHSEAKASRPAAAGGEEDIDHHNGTGTGTQSDGEASTDTQEVTSFTVPIIRRDSSLAPSQYNTSKSNMFGDLSALDPSIQQVARQERTEHSQEWIQTGKRPREDSPAGSDLLYRANPRTGRKSNKNVPEIDQSSREPSSPLYVSTRARQPLHDDYDRRQDEVVDLT